MREEDFDFEAVDVFAGIFRELPARRLSFFMPLADLICATVTPYFRAIVESVSPFRMVWVVAFAVLFFGVAAGEAVDFVAEGLGVVDAVCVVAAVAMSEAATADVATRSC